jgi:signal transduction histidine kinase
MQMTDRGLVPFDRILTVLILGVIIGSIGVITLFTYSESASILVERDSLLRHHAETTLTDSYTRFAEQSLSVSDTALTSRMRTIVPRMLEEYERAGRDPTRMNLSAFRQELGPESDIRVFDGSGTIVASADGMEPGIVPRSPGLPLFPAPGPDGFESRPMMNDPSTDRYRKNVSVTTSDGLYRIEVELLDDWFGFRSQQIQQQVSDVMNTDPSVRTVRIFNLTKQESDPFAPTTSPEVDDRLDRVIAARQMMDFPDNGNSTISRYLFLDLAEIDTDTDPSVVIELVYSTRDLEDALLRLQVEYASIALSVIVMAIVLTFVFSSRMTRPIRSMIGDIEAIAAGDLNHPMRSVAVEEFDSLRRSILRMVDGLRQHQDRLEQRVEERTRQLVEANEEAHLYLDIMTHDINNSLTVALASCECLADELADGKREEAGRVCDAIRQSSGIIERVAWARSLRDQDAALEPVSLAAEIRKVLATAELAVDYDGKDSIVLADRFLPEVFINLIGNSRKFGGPDVRCSITIDAGEQIVTVTFADEGPGIPDSQKDRVFGRFVRGSGPGAGSGLGLWIVYTLIHRYGGRCWVEDRVPGAPERGVAILFTLRRPQ